MKTKILSLLAMLVSVFALTGCDDWEPGQEAFPKGTGGVNLSEMRLDVTAQSRAMVDVSTFIVTVIDEEGAPVSYDGQLCSWAYAQMPEVVTLPQGTYTIRVISHNVEKAAWEAPLFEGESEPFEVEAGKISDIGTVTCSFASIKVSVQYDDELTSLMEADAQVKVVAGQDAELLWSGTETRAGYFQAVEGSSTLVATFTGTVAGAKLTHIKEFTDVSKGKYYIITFHVKGASEVPDETGDVTPGGISIGSDIDEQDENGDVVTGEDPADGGDRPDGEEWPEEPTDPENPDDPQVGELFTFDTRDPVTGDPGMNLEGWNAIVAGKTYKLNITSQNPLTNLKVTIISQYLTDSFLRGVGLCAAFDLADPGEYEEALTGMGFPVGDQVVGKKYVEFDLTEFIPLLLTAPSGQDQHTFKLELVDDAGNHKIVELKFDATL